MKTKILAKNARITAPKIRSQLFTDVVVKKEDIDAAPARKRGTDLEHRKAYKSAYSKKWYLRNKQKVKDAYARWCTANPDAVKSYQQQYRDANKEAAKLYGKAYREKNKELLRAKRLARKLKRMP